MTGTAGAALGYLSVDLGSAGGRTLAVHLTVDEQERDGRRLIRHYHVSRDT